MFRELNKQKGPINIDESQGKQLEDMMQLVTFRITEEEFGIDILKVQEIIRMTEITRVPNANSYVNGVINLRGKIIPIVDLRVRLGMPKIEATIQSRIIVIEQGDIVAGMIVDEVNQVARVNKNAQEPPPPMVGGVDAGFITSIVNLRERIIILLDLQRVFQNVEDLELLEA